MINLTKQSLASLKPRTKPHVDYDGELIGFGVAVLSDAKAWMCEYRQHRGGRGVANKTRDAWQDASIDARTVGLPRSMCPSRYFMAARMGSAEGRLAEADRPGRDSRLWGNLRTGGRVPHDVLRE